MGQLKCQNHPTPSLQLRTWGRWLQEILLYLGWLGGNFGCPTTGLPRAVLRFHELLLVPSCSLYVFTICIYMHIYTRFYTAYIFWIAKKFQETVRIMECACSVFRVLCENEDWFYSMVGLCWYQLHLSCIDASCISHKDMKSHGPTWKPKIWQFPEIRICVCVCALFVQYILCSLTQYISTHTPCISCD